MMDNVNKALYVLCDDVTVGLWSMCKYTVFLHTVVKYFALSECTFLEIFASINNVIYIISFCITQHLQIINTEETVDLFSIV